MIDLGYKSAFIPGWKKSFLNTLGATTMKTITFLITTILIGIFSASASAQTLDMPEYTIDQRWEQAAQLYLVSSILYIRLEMETGKSAEEIGLTIATILGPSWSNVTSPAIMAQALHRIWLVWPEAEFTVEEDPDGSVTIRANRPYQHIFGESGILFDVSV